MINEREEPAPDLRFEKKIHMGTIRNMRGFFHIDFHVRALLVKLANEVDDLRASHARAGEPVAWIWPDDLQRLRNGDDDVRAEVSSEGADHMIALYAAPPAPVGVDAAGISKAAADVLAERRRRVEIEGWTSTHDDDHTGGELAKAAACYAVAATLDDFIREEYISSKPQNVQFIRDFWPWELPFWNPRDRRRDLIRAGVLIIAEIERLDRAVLSAAGITDTSKETGNG